MTQGKQIVVNGERRGLDVRTLAELAAQLGCGPDRPGVAIAVNGRVVRRASWGDRPIEPGDEIEIVGAAQGG